MRRKLSMIYISINTVFALIALVASLVFTTSFSLTDNAVIEAILEVMLGILFVFYLLFYIPILLYVGAFLWIPHIVLFGVLLIAEIKTKEKNKRYITAYSVLFAVNACLNVLTFWNMYILENYYTITV